MTISVKDGGTWKEATPHVKDAGVWKPVVEGHVKEGGVWKKFYPDAPPVTVTMSPGDQIVPGGGTAAYTFSESIGVSGGTATSYTWDISPQAGEGGWSISSGQGTASAGIRVGGTIVGEFNQAQVVCDVVVDGVTHNVYATLSYER